MQDPKQTDPVCAICLKQSECDSDGLWITMWTPGLLGKGNELMPPELFEVVLLTANVFPRTMLEYKDVVKNRMVLTLRSLQSD